MPLITCATQFATSGSTPAPDAVATSPLGVMKNCTTRARTLAQTGSLAANGVRARCHRESLIKQSGSLIQNQGFSATVMPMLTADVVAVAVTAAMAPSSCRSTTSNEIAAPCALVS